MRALARPVCDALLGGPRAQIVLGACACVAGAATLFAFDPAHHALYPGCLFHRATGFYCAGCGATRAAYALLHGRVLEAAHDNVLFVAALPFLLYFGGAWLNRAWRSRAWPELDPNPVRWSAISAVLVTALLAFMVIRNLPGAEWLRPQ